MTGIAKFRSAPIGVYVDWLRGYIAAGGEPTHYHDYPYSRRGFILAQADFTTGDERGSRARSVLVPEGIRYLGGGLGHNDLYFFEGFVAPTPSCVPIYSDGDFLSLPGVVTFIAERKKSFRAFLATMQQREAASLEAMRNSDLGRFVLAEREARETDR